MIETVELMSKRRSVAPIALDGPGPDRDQLSQILALGSRVPDHGKLVPWRVIVFEGDARRRAGELAGALYAADHPEAPADRQEFERLRLQRAPTILGIVSRAAPHAKIPEWEQIMSAGAFCMNLTLAANALGFATTWLTEWMAYDRRFLSQIGLSDSEKMAGFLHIGRAKAKPEDRVRPNLADFVTYFE